MYLFWTKILFANSVDPGQTPHSAASDLGLRYLPMSLKKDAKIICFSFLFHIKNKQCRMPQVSLHSLTVAI